MLQDLYLEFFKGHFLVQQVGNTGRSVQGDMLRLDQLFIRHDDGQLNHRLQLPDVTREGILQQLLLGLGGKRLSVYLIFLTEAVNKVFRKNENIISPFSQWRQQDGQPDKTIV